MILDIEMICTPPLKEATMLLELMDKLWPASNSNDELEVAKERLRTFLNLSISMKLDPIVIPLRYRLVYMAVITVISPQILIPFENMLNRGLIDYDEWEKASREN